MIKQVIFDFGGVVVEWRPDDIVARLYADERDRKLIKAEVFQHPDWLEFDRGTVDEPILVTRFSARTGRPAAEFEVLLEHVRASLKPIPETVALLQELAAREVPLYGLSNMPSASFDQLLRLHDFWRLFKGIVISGRIKIMKPQPEIFHHLCREHGLVPAESVFIDDNPPNLEVAAELGFRVIHFTSAQQCREQLLPLLDGAAQ